MPWSWMHCETTVDPEGTWKGSWRALEKAYSEGLVNTIGVSNFDRPLLEELTKFAIVQPHFVQNFAEPGKLDMDVRKFCTDFKILYQPYASGRNIEHLPEDIKETVYKIAEKHSQSPYAVILRFFVQTGSTTIIPRSNNLDHLHDNVKVFDWKLDDEDMLALGWGDITRNEL
jgi:methylglyoxal/glyoxal reductase